MNFITYKGYPLVRKGNEMYFGFMSDPYVVMLQAGKTKKVRNYYVAGQVQLYLMSTDDTLDPTQAIIKNGERDSLYDALDMAVTWLEKKNKKD